MNKVLLLLMALSPVALGIEFYSGNKTYFTEKVSAQISEEYGHKFQITTIFIAAETENHPLYAKQWRELKNIDPEALQLIFVSSLANSTDKGGYFTTPETAKSVLSGSDFRVLVVSPKGSELMNSETVLTAAVITDLVQSHNKALHRTSR